AELVAGWSKNIVTGGLLSVPPWARPLAPALAVATGVVLWLAPPMALAYALPGGGGETLLPWAALTCGASALLWALFTRGMGAPAAYGLLYPLGAAVATYILVCSWVRGRRVEWKGRSYELPRP